MSVDAFLSDRATLDERIALLEQIAPHWAPVARMVRDYGLMLFSIQQGEKRRFWPRPVDARLSPVLIYLGDDMATSKGPVAFHRGSLRRLFKDAGSVVLNAGEARPEPYSAAGLIALILGKPAVIVDCLPETQDTWIRFGKACGRRDGDFVVFGVQGEPPTACANRISVPLEPLPEPTVH